MATMATTSPRMAHIGSFTLLFFLAFLRPAAIWPELPFSFAPLTVLVIGLLLIVKVHYSVGITAWCKTNKTPLLLAGGFHLACLASLWFNQHRYANTHELIQWGATFFVIQGALTASAFLFFLPYKAHRFSLTQSPFAAFIPLVIALLIPISAISQVYAPEQTLPLMQYFVSGNGELAITIRGITSTSTDLGAISGLFVVASTLFLPHFWTYHKLIFAILILAIMLNIAAGLLSGARIFLLELLVAASVFLLQTMRNKPKYFLTSSIGFLSGLILLLQHISTHTAVKLSKILPLTLPLALGIPLTASDFWPNLHLSAFGDREVIWRMAWQQIIDNPWLGISNGGFRLANAAQGYSPINNTHNAFLQAGIDAGLIGFSCFIGLCLFIVYKANNAMLRLFLCVCLASLCVDNFTDHSLPWILLATFSAALFMRYTSTEETRPQTPSTESALLQSHSTHKRIPLLPISARHLLSIALLSLSVPCTYFIYRTHQLSQAPVAAQFTQVYPLFSVNHYQRAPAMLSETLTAIRQQFPSKFTLAHHVIAASQLCNYAYPKAHVLHHSDEQIQNIKNTRYISQLLSLSTLNSTQCEPTFEQPLSGEHWLANFPRFLHASPKNHTAQHSLAAMQITADRVIAWSPLFALTSKTYSLSFEAHSLLAACEMPTIFLHAYDADTDHLLKQQSYVLNGVSQRFMFQLPTDTNTNRAYLTLSSSCKAPNAQRNIDVRFLM